MKKELSSLVYRGIRNVVRLVYPKMTVVGEENLPEGTCIVVGNHSQMHGPIAMQLYFPGDKAIWCAGPMMHLKEVPAYAYADFWSQKPRWCRPFYKLLSHIIAPISVCVFNNADTIGVYRDNRIITTFKNTVKRMKMGSRIIIFPETYKSYNQILCGFQDKFVDVARLYCRQTGESVSFVPMYIAPYLRKIYLGKPIAFCPDIPIEEERTRIVQELMSRITEIAEALPEHTVVPYPNLPKKQYPTNHSQEAIIHEKTGC